MLQERLNAIREELLEVEHLPELKAMWCNWQAEAEEVANDALCQLMLRSTLSRLRLFVEQRVPEEMAPAAAPRPASKPLAARGPSSRKYVLLKKEVNWSSTPQVISIMQIIGAHANEGDVLEEDHILRMLEENKHVFKTRQPVRKVFAYYKGDWNGGLQAHGNIRRVE
jgi:hypothetical protein